MPHLQKGLRAGRGDGYRDARLTEGREADTGTRGGCRNESGRRDERRTEGRGLTTRARATASGDEATPNPQNADTPEGGFGRRLRRYHQKTNQAARRNGRRRGQGAALKLASPPKRLTWRGHEADAETRGCTEKRVLDAGIRGRKQRRGHERLREELEHRPSTQKD